MPEFTWRMRYSGTAWQVCPASRYLVGSLLVIMGGQHDGVLLSGNLPIVFI